MARLKKFLVDLKNRYFALTPGQRLVYAAAGIAGILAIVLLIMLSGKSDYGVLFSNLTQDDAGAIIAKLKAQKIPYQIEAGGTTLLVPKSEVYDLRLSLASEGLPQGGGVGFELFDRQSMGTTEFVQRLNYQRALQGELARTICRFPEIEEARVHVVTPKESLFIEEQKKPSAAVVLKLRRGRCLSAAQIEGIVNLVASSVEGLHPDQVTVVDMTGKILSKPHDSLASGKLTTAQMEYQQQLEAGLRGKVQSMLDKILGPNRSIVRIAAELDFQHIDVQEDHYTPDQKLIRSEQRTVERSTLEGAARGIPESRYSLDRGTVTPTPSGQGPPPLTAPPPTPQAKPRQGELERQSEIRNYEINHVNRRIVEYPGKIKRLSVAVVVDGLYQNAGKKEEVAQFNPRSPQEMEDLANVIKKAVGFDRDRGDQFEMTCIPLAPSFEAGVVARAPEKGWQTMLWENLKMGFVILFVLVLLMFLLRRRRSKTIPALEPPPVRELPPTLEDLEHPPSLAADVPGKGLPSKPTLSLPEVVEGKEKVAQILAVNPERAVEVLRLWLYE